MNNPITDLFKDAIDSIAEMTKGERMIKLAELATKEHLNQILPHEIIQLSFIQAIRQENGEIATVLKNWKENPHLDPRNDPTL